MIEQKLLEKIAAVTRNELEHVQQLRHALHQIPERGLEEYKTSTLLRTELLAIGLDICDQFGGTTGLVADMYGGKGDGCVVLRADMDALPVQEASGVPYHSLHSGYSHCCGHDGHAACVIGAARVLHKLADQWTGQIRFLFQPAEEISRGAQDMIEAGLFCPKLPDAIFALHAWPGMPTGTVACKPGTLMAASDSFHLTIIGKGGHGARPGLARNPLAGLASVIPRLTQMNNAERIVSPCVAAVGEKVNIISDTGLLAGTVRTLTPAVRDQTMSEMQQVCREACAQVGLDCQLEFETGCPRVVTAEEMYRTFKEVATASLGQDKVMELESPSMGSEDFGYYLEHIPGLMFRLGMGNDSPELHNCRFDFNDNALAAGIQVLAALAIEVCSRKS